MGHPERQALVVDFMKNFKKLAPDVRYASSDNSEMVEILRKMTKKAWNSNGATPYKERPRRKEDKVRAGSWFDFQNRYNLLCKLVEHLQKYDEKSVEIDDLPEGALVWKIAPYVCG